MRLDDIETLHQRIIEGTRAAAKVAMERARQTGTPLILWKNGRVVEVRPDKAPKNLAVLKISPSVR